MRRAWFQDEDGTYYRNCPLIAAEMRACISRWWSGHRFRKLDREWHQAFRAGVIRADQIGPGDIVVQPLPFREAYPEHPGIWQLDERD